MISQSQRKLLKDQMNDATITENKLSQYAKQIKEYGLDEIKSPAVKKILASAVEEVPGLAAVRNSLYHVRMRVFGRNSYYTLGRFFESVRSDGERLRGFKRGELSAEIFRRAQEWDFLKMAQDERRYRETVRDYITIEERKRLHERLEGDFERAFLHIKVLKSLSKYGVEFSGQVYSPKEEFAHYMASHQCGSELELIDEMYDRTKDNTADKIAVSLSRNSESSRLVRELQELRSVPGYLRGSDTDIKHVTDLVEHLEHMSPQDLRCVGVKEIIH
ncbi:MAG TPA: hypothetical protein ENN13_03050 [Candidatus Altiarchaeales archaeon]|nr:hypothetical protein [Candidatus Altiarchaeales archaeon]